MVVMLVDCCVGWGQYFRYYSYSRNPTGREFFDPARTLIAVNLLTDRYTDVENKGRIVYDYQVGHKVPIQNDGILRKAESRYLKKPWTIMTVHTN
jgi:hypothetical protein